LGSGSNLRSEWSFRYAASCWVDVGNGDSRYRIDIVSGHLRGFHTRQRSEVESFEIIAQSVDSRAEVGIVRDRLLNFFEAMNHGRMIPTAESISNFNELCREKLAGEVHRDLSWGRQSLCAGFRP
jgi:hypothetical protein